MDEEEELLVNHIIKCRCCFKSLGDAESTVKVSKAIERLFFELTQMELKSSHRKYSQKICPQCDAELRHFGKLKKDLIRRQKRLYEFTERDKAKNRPSRKCNEKKLSAASFEEEHADLFVKLEVKQEEVEEPNNGTCVIVEPLATVSSMMMPYVKLEKFKFDEISQGPLIPEHFYESDGGKDRRLSARDNSEDDDDDDGVEDPFDEFFKSHKTKAKPKNKYKRKRDRKSFIKHFCPHCDKFFLSQENLQAHIDFVHFKLKNFACSKCNFKTYSAAFLRGHEKRVHSGIVAEAKPKEKKPCPICGLLVQKISTHTRNVHTRPKNVFCDICGFGIYNLNRLRSHMHKHLSKEEKHHLGTFHCDLCGAQVHSRNSISAHMRNIHQEEGNLYRCHCGKSYRALSYLKIHQKSHEKNPRHKCSQCEKAFMNLSQLKIHLEIHERGKRKDFSCEICGKMYGSESLLQRHKIFHTEPTLPCSYCNKKFHRQCLLIRHIKRTHEIELGECEYCGKQLNVLSLQRHIKEFHSNFPRKTCPVLGCNSSFLRKFHMKDHVGRMHKEYLARMTAEEKDEFEKQLNEMILI